ncbi:hypothetical protein SAMN05444266_11416 [Chitinophaga jiangningensis]|uniref:4-amino-4-deoxy-L-arabinose transferase n=1 Tax=Chitinophaga jiangningensis TaxID=1419482 RepID=A0A1M7MP74_9BACT|nr:hypothetical protein [Chitinophaga jiangningensis]SHM92723.1 hypothetical protein SAMN05444266_11416 [Chitinophaga jiangningensis]
MKNNKPLYTAWIFLTVLLIFSWYKISRLTGGHFCYSLDDAFIHMAVAKNFALHGVWGITSDAYGSASSSPLFTVVLAAIYRTGINGYMVGFWINVVAAYLLLYSTHRILLNYGMPEIGRVVVLVALIILLPFTVMILTGMEHLLHLWFSLLFVQVVVEMITADKVSVRQMLVAGAYGALMIGARFESLFLLGAAGLLLLFYRKIGTALVVGVIAVLPVVIFAVVSVAYGGYILPNSVLLKSSGGSASSGSIAQALQDIIVYRLMYGNSTVLGLFNADHAKAYSSSISGTSLIRILIILPLLVVLVRVKGAGSLTKQAVNFGIIVSIGCALHLALAAVGWMFRYEAYLVGLAIVSISMLLWCVWPQITSVYQDIGIPQKAVLLLLLFFAGSPLLARALSGYRIQYRACRNIYDQQLQMGRFLQQYYPETSVAANDIGAVSFLSDSRIIDVWGLGNNEVAKSKLTGHYSDAFLGGFLKKEHVKIAVIYKNWYSPELYGKWTSAGDWTIQDNVVCADKIVHFFALDSADAPALRRNLEAFKAELPASVTSAIY